MKLTFTLKKAPDFIFGYLTDMNKFVAIHPVISKIEALGDDRFFVHETLRFGFIPYSFSYPVMITSDREGKTITFKATIQKMTQIEMHFSIREENGHSIVDEEISIRTPLPVKGIIRKVFRDQHAQLFKNLENLDGG